jgi:putative phosphoribosyl transferase
MHAQFDLDERPAHGDPLFVDRVEAGRRLALDLAEERSRDTVVVGLARGGVVVAAEVARALEAPLDSLAVRQGVRSPTAGIRARCGHGTRRALPAPQGRARRPRAARGCKTGARTEADELDRRLHVWMRPLDVFGRTVLVVDDGLATGATMIAALRHIRAGGAARVVAAFPVGARASLGAIRREADAIVCPHVLDPLYAVGTCYRGFGHVDEAAVGRLLVEARGRADARGARP